MPGPKTPDAGQVHVSALNDIRALLLTVFDMQCEIESKVTGRKKSVVKKAAIRLYRQRRRRLTAKTQK